MRCHRSSKFSIQSRSSPQSPFLIFNSQQVWTIKMKNTCGTFDSGLKCGLEFCCCFCNRKLHLTTDCTKLNADSIKILKNLKANFIHICNDCKLRKSELVPENSFTHKIDAQMKDMQQQMNRLTEEVENRVIKKRVVRGKSKRVNKIWSTALRLTPSLLGEWSSRWAPFNEYLEFELVIFKSTAQRRRHWHNSELYEHWKKKASEITPIRYIRSFKT